MHQQPKMLRHVLEDLDGVASRYTSTHTCEARTALGLSPPALKVTALNRLDRGAVGIHGVASRAAASTSPCVPSTGLSRSLRRPSAHVRHRLVADGSHVVADHFLDARPAHGSTASTCSAAAHQRLDPTPNVARVGALHRDAHHRAGLRPPYARPCGPGVSPVSSSVNLRIRIVRMQTLNSAFASSSCGCRTAPRLGPRSILSLCPTPRASGVRNVVSSSPVSRRRMLRNAAFASSVVASMPTVLPRTRPASARCCSTQAELPPHGVSTLSNRRSARSSSGRASAIRAARTTHESDRRLNVRPHATPSPAPSRGLRHTRQHGSRL